MHTETLLHLGSGGRKLPGWVNVDSRDDVGADIVGDVRDLSAWGPNEVDGIYACHVLEHIPRPEIISTLREWRRVLKPGKTLKVSVPSFEAAVDLYNNGVSMWRLQGLLQGRQDYDWNEHHVVFDYEYLSWMLAEAGFYNIHRWTPGAWLPADYDDYSRARIDNRNVSLNVEGTA